MRSTSEGFNLGRRELRIKNLERISRRDLISVETVNVIPRRGYLLVERELGTNPPLSLGRGVGGEGFRAAL